MKSYNISKVKKHGFSLIEALIGIMIIGVVGISVFMVISTSNRTSLADYYRITGESLVAETLEVFQCLGYDELIHGKNTTIAGYGTDVWQHVKKSTKAGIVRPAISSSFLRKIVIEPIENKDIKSVFVSVYIKPKVFFMSGLGEISGNTVVIKKEK